MAQPPQAVSDHYESQKRLTVATLAVVRREWSRMSGDWDAAWRTVGPRVTAVVTAGQLGAARAGTVYVPATLTQLGQSVDPVAQVDPRRFAGTAADGRPLVTLLAGAVPTSRRTGSLERGGNWLDMVVESELADADRGAQSVAIATRPGVGWIRMVNTPCCKDCAVQAGRFFRKNTGFLRHPHCRCTHLATTDPATVAVQTPDPSQITGLTEPERRALGQGADLSQVVNAQRGASKLTTTEGTTRRSVNSPRLRGRRRLTPDGIYAIASDDDEALRLLRANGYLL